MTPHGTAPAPATKTEAGSLGRERGAALSSRLYAAILTEEALNEAAKFENVGVEIALLRDWLDREMNEQDFNIDLALKLIDRIVKAVAVRYKLSPQRTENFAAALTTVLEYSNGVDREDEEV